MKENGQLVLADRYRLARRLASQAETEIWAADDLRLERRVRVELLKLAPAPDALATERFWARARDAAHTSGETGRVLDAGTDPVSGQPFVVSEWPEPLSSPETPTAPAATAHAAPTRRSGAAQRRQDGRPRRLGGMSPGWRSNRGLLVAGAVAILAVGGYFAGAGFSNVLAWINEPLGQQRSPFSLAIAPAPAIQLPAVRAQSGQATATPAGPPPTVAAAPRTSSQQTPTPTAAAATKPGASTATAAGTVIPLSGRSRIVNTDGQGVALRSSPGGDRLPAKGYDEGVTVAVLERSGPWTHIRGDDGRDGWVPNVTLTP